MKLAVTSQNFRTITGHAGKTRRFIIFAAEDNETAVEIDRLDLAKEMSMHAWQGGAHPIDNVDVLITGGCGEGFIHKMARRNIQVVRTSETDPVTAVTAILQGQSLPPAEAHHH